jgi:hypothetical protein
MAANHWIMLAGWIGVGCALGAATLPQPDDYLLERIVGNRIDTSIPSVEWKTAEPASMPPAIYSAELMPFDAALMERVARAFSVAGEVVPIPESPMKFEARFGSLLNGPVGFWINDGGATNSGHHGCVAYYHRGLFFYGSGEEPYHYDLLSKTFLVHGVPENPEAIRKAVALFPLLGITTNDLEVRKDGRLVVLGREQTIGYTDRADMKAKRLVVQRTVIFIQRIPQAGVSAGIGDGGTLEFSFGSEGRVAAIQWCFRPLTKVGEAKPMTAKNILRAIHQAKSFCWLETVPHSLIVTNCSLAYPQGNSFLFQDHLWPFYMLTCKSDNRGGITLFVPTEW